MAIDFELISNTPPADTLFEVADKLNLNFARLNIALEGMAPWGVSEDYIVDDKVTANGSVWRCILLHTSANDDEPGEGVNYATYWILVSVMLASATGAEINAGTDDVKFTTSKGIGDSDLIFTNDSRLSDARVPTSHGNDKHSSTFITAADAIAPSMATATPTISKIPIADGSGKLDGWVTSAVVPDPETQQAECEAIYNSISPKRVPIDYIMAYCKEVAEHLEMTDLGCAGSA